MVTKSTDPGSKPGKGSDAEQAKDVARETIVQNASNVEEPLLDLGLQDLVVAVQLDPSPAQEISASFQQAFLDYAKMSEKEFVEEAKEALAKAIAEKGPNFLNLEFEQLFDVELQEGGSDATRIVSNGSEGGVNSLERFLSVRNIFTSGEEDELFKVQSQPQNLAFNTVAAYPYSVPPTQSPDLRPDGPRAPPLDIPPPANEEINITETALNTQPFVLIQSNIFVPSIFNNFIAASVGSGLQTMDAFFNVPARAGSSEVHTSGLTTLTTPEGNVFTFNRITGDYSYQLNNAVLHLQSVWGANYVDVLQEVFTDRFVYSITDTTNQTAVGAISVFILDGHPLATDQTTVAITEADIQSVGSNQSPSAEQLPGSLVFSPNNIFGADGGTVSNVVLTSATSNGVTNATGSTSISSGTITVTDSEGNTFVIDQATGSFAYNLNNAYTNINNQPTVLVFTFTFTDADLDSISKTITITVNDDAPVALAQNAGTLGEADIILVGSSANPTAPTLIGDITSGGTLLGADGGTVTNVVLTSALSNGNSNATANTSIALGVITVTDSEGNTLVVNPNGTYTYTLNNSYSNTANFPTVLVYTYTLTDSDGSTASNTLTITVDDDGPVALAQNAGSIDEADIILVGSSANPTAPTLIGDITTGSTLLGADGGTVTNVVLTSALSNGNSNATANTTIALGVITVTDSEGNTLVVNPNGTYTYTLNNAYTNSSNFPTVLVYTYTLTDSDGTVASNTLTISVDDDGPVALAQNAGSIDEADIVLVGSDANPTAPTITGDITTGATLLGADGGTVTNVILTSALSNGNSNATANTTIALGVITVTDSEGNTLVVNPNGTYTYTLNNAYTNSSNFPTVLVYTYTLTDSDGTVASNTLTISVDDDGPVALAQNAGSLDEADIVGVGSDANLVAPTITGDITTGSTLLGADGGSVTNVVLTSALSNGNSNATANTTIALGVITVTDSEGNTLVVNPNGTYTYTLNNAYSNTANFPTVLVYTYTLTDSDGTVASNTLTISVDDDGPVALAQNAGSLDEADIVGVGSDANLVAPTITGDITTGSTLLGADGGTVTNVVLTSSLSNGNSNATANTTIALGVITVTDSEGNTLVVNPNGTYTYTLNNAYSNTANFPTVLVYTYTLTDSDGTVASNTLTISVDDDGPVALAQNAGSIDEADIVLVGSSANPTAPTIAGDITTGSTLLGADGGTVTNVVLTSALSNGNSNATASTSILMGVITVTDSEGNSLVVNPDGTYIYTLSNAYFNSNSFPTILTYTYTLTDLDGTTSSSTLTVNINDDAPIATNIAGGSVNEADIPVIGSSPDATAPTTSGTLLNGAGNVFGADGGSVSNVTIAGGVTGATLTTITVTTAEGNVLVVNRATGAYTYTLNAPIDNDSDANLSTTQGTDIFNYTFTDNDGDPASANLTITINDDVPIATNITGGTVDEANLPAGSDPDAPALTTSGTLLNGAGNVFGADGGSVSAVTISGSTSNVVTATTITVTTAEGNVLVVTRATGAYTYTLNAPIDNDSDANPSTTVGTDIFNYTFTDNDGDTAAANLTITINDDVPIATNITGGTLNEADIPVIGSDPDATAPTTSGTLLNGAGNVFGADGGSVSAVTISGSTSNVVTATTITVTTAEGNVLVVTRATGAYTYTLNAPIDNDSDANPSSVLGTDVFNYTFTDNDGDTAAANLTITINDDVPIATNITGGTLNEADIPVIGSDPDATAPTTSGTLLNGAGNVFGADGGSVSAVTISGSTSNVVTATTITVTTAEGNVLVVTRATGAYTYTLNAPITNANPSETQATDIFNYTFTDNDGDTAAANLTITINDDVPIATDQVATPAVNEADIVDSVSGTLIGSGNSFGADGGSVTNITIIGGTTVFGVNTITVTTAEGNELVVNTLSGAYTYTLNAPITNANPSETQSTDIFNYTFTDNDGDTAAANLTITINDDVPEANQRFNSVDETALFVNGIETAAGNLLSEIAISSFGADGGVISSINGISDGGLGDQDLTQNGLIIAATLYGNINVNMNTGAYVYSLDSDQTAPVPDNLLNVIDSITYVLTDDDGDISSSTLDIAIDLNQAPLAVVDSIPDISEDSASIIIDVLSNDTDPDLGDTKSLISVLSYSASFNSESVPIDKSSAISSGNQLQFDPATDFNFLAVGQSAIVTIDYQMADAEGLTSNSTLTFTVNGVNDNPVAEDDTFYNFEGTATGNLFDNDSDPDFDTLTVIAINGSPTFTDIELTNGGILNVNPTTGEITYTGLGLEDTFEYQISDGNGGTSIATVQILEGVPPVILDLNNNNKIDLISSERSEVSLNSFEDTHGTNRMGWVKPGDGILVYDHQGDGKVTHIDEIALTLHSDAAKTDLDALRILFDSNKDGVFDAKDEKFDQFGVWQDKNSDGLSDAGEYQTLTQMGIISINVNSDHQVQMIEGNTVHGFTSYTTADGVSHVAGDVALNVAPATRSVAIESGEVIEEHAAIDLSNVASLAPLASDNDSIVSLTSQNAVVAGLDTAAPSPVTVIQQIEQQHQETPLS